MIIQHPQSLSDHSIALPRAVVVSLFILIVGLVFCFGLAPHVFAQDSGDSGEGGDSGTGVSSGDPSSVSTDVGTTVTGIYGSPTGGGGGGSTSCACSAEGSHGCISYQCTKSGSGGGGGGGPPPCPVGTTGKYPKCVPLAGCTVVNVVNASLGFGGGAGNVGGGTVSRCGTTPTGGTCPANYRLVGNNCVFASCPAGQSTTVDSSGIVECGCPIGYIYESVSKGSTAGAGASAGGAGVGPSGTNNPVVATHDQCVFTQCPAGYTQTTNAQLRASSNGVANSGPSGGYGAATGIPTAAGSGNKPICELTTPTAPTSCTPRLLCDTDGNLHEQNADCTIADAPATPLCQYGCAGSTCNPAPVPKIVTFGLAPSLVQSGKTTVVSWNVVNVANCTVIGSNMPPDLWSQPTGSTSWIGSGVSSPIVGQTIYTLHCTPLNGWQYGVNGAAASWIDQTVTVDIVPTFHEQ